MISFVRIDLAKIRDLRHYCGDADHIASIYNDQRFVGGLARPYNLRGPRTITDSFLLLYHYLTTQLQYRVIAINRSF